jgi:hypothetical protein
MGFSKPHAEVDLTDEQFKNSEVQNFIRMGLLQGDNSQVDNYLTEYKNLANCTLSFSWGQNVRSKQTFLLIISILVVRKLRALSKRVLSPELYP